MEMAEAGYRCKTRPAMMLMLVASRGRIKGTANGFPMDGSNQSGITTQGRGPNPAGMGTCACAQLWQLLRVPRPSSALNELLTAANPKASTAVQQFTGSTALMRQCFQREEPRAGTLAAALAGILAPVPPVKAPERLGSFGGTCHGARQAILQVRTSASPHLRTALENWEHVS